MPQHVEVSADMVASVLRVVATTGQRVREGDPLLLVESMKMEIPVLAPVSGVVVTMDAEPGEVVAEGDLLAVIRAE